MYLKRLCILQLHIALYVGQLGQVAQLCGSNLIYTTFFFFWTYKHHIFKLFFLSDTELNVLSSPFMNLSISPFNLINFCCIYFEAMLLGEFKI